MSVIRAQVIIPAGSGTPRDAVTNTWHFKTPDVLPATQALVMTQLADFYNTEGANARSVGDFIGDDRAKASTTVKLYSLSEPPPRVPLSETPMPIVGLAASQNLPTEVAVCVSFVGADPGGVPIRRRRGRIYLGPLSAEVLEEFANVARVHDNMLDTLHAAAVRLIDFGSPTDPTWAVYSPTSDETLGVDASSFDVVSGWIDNEFDTQRRRGIRASERRNFS